MNMTDRGTNDSPWRLLRMLGSAWCRHPALMSEAVVAAGEAATTDSPSSVLHDGTMHCSTSSAASKKQLQTLQQLGLANHNSSAEALASNTLAEALAEWRLQCDNCLLWGGLFWGLYDRIGTAGCQTYTGRQRAKDATEGRR